jgi:C4-dicarboxylate-specific signal transduction histidine kinase
VTFPALLRNASGPLLTAVAYGIGVAVGFHLRFPGATTSVLWPPNAILTVALFMAPPSRWWIYLLAAFPAHLLTELPLLEPMPVVLLFVTNSCEALLAAALVRGFNDTPRRFDTLHRMVVFIGAAFAAPFLSSFLDAAIVSAFVGERYWSIWTTRVIGNSLTELTLVPPAVILLSRYRELRSWPRRRLYEAVALGAAVIVMGFGTFGGYLHQAWPMSRLPAISLPLTVSLLLLVALRFGPAGVSLSFMTTAAIMIWFGIDGRGPFAMLPPADSVLAVQTFLILEAVPLMCLAAIMEERRNAEIALRGRLAFERLLSHLSREVVGHPTSEVPARFEGWLASCGEFFRAEELLLLQIGTGAGGIVPSHAWARDRTERRLAIDDQGRFADVIDVVGLGSPITLPDVVVAPLTAARQTIGGLAMRGDPSRSFTKEDLERLQLIAEVFANVLVRKRVEDERTQAEVEAQRSRTELAHFNRLSTMGELTGSLAHELNQPLTGILSNAQAARRILNGRNGDAEELRDVLADIIADVQRAGETIQRIRKVLRKADIETVTLDLNSIVVDVVGLLKSDAIIRNLQIELNLWPGKLNVVGNHVELRQVILNLILNAMDAMASAGQQQPIVVTSELSDDRVIHVAIQDYGEGVPPSATQQIFEPFYTTKPNGMGMGLSIARSIVEAHGGSIWMTKTTDRGALFEFILPHAHS